MTTDTEALLAALAAAPRQALPATRLAALVRAAGVDAGRFAGALAALADGGRVAVLDPPPPDRHLADTDLRVVAAVAGPAGDDPADAYRRARQAWEEILRGLLAAHRCQ
ncbi:hypothetical protein [Actinacidiphila paucisporea]|uniref:Uncharacterized protein n=1 Tax=Actinacidiphila paucisporea TaxID=310782 RepID=A0A1M7G5L5_9ACTN|nr:hypothetical protein [Actinacidiphila paucisporea]SHM11486.1 hypothetical protein SAMN05216499_108153 [Actinacidiphila paucisporea]